MISVPKKKKEYREKNMAKTGVKTKKLSTRQLNAKARKLGINPLKMEKTELIHSIQRAEGYNACFGQANGYCPQDNCCFRDDCLS